MKTYRDAQNAEAIGDTWLQGAYTRVAATIAGFTGRAERAKPAAQPAADAARSARLFAQALREDSNLAMDWLWYAAQIADEAKRRYCIERALAINPDSELAKRALAELPPSVEVDDKLFFARPADHTV
jgi:hypothetical protein